MTPSEPRTTEPTVDYMFAEPLPERLAPETDPSIATIEDYVTARDLVNPIYEASATGASMRLRQVVEAVSTIRKSPGQLGPVTVTAIARHLNVARGHHYVKRALEEGWLKNTGSWWMGTAFDLVVGDTLPPHTSLPQPDELKGEPIIAPETGRTPERSPAELSLFGSPESCRTPGRTVQDVEDIGETRDHSGVRPETGESQAAHVGTVRPTASGSRTTRTPIRREPIPRECVPIPRTPVK